MDVEQELEWKAAQSTAISVQLVPAAKRHLKFLATVDRNRWLYQSPGLERAIYRYNACWLPLLAKHLESPFFEGPLVVPFDCEWIWHCHRLNPVRYKSDCEEFYGRILDNENIVSSLEVTSGSETEKVWKMLYSAEPFQMDSSSALQDNAYAKKGDEKCTKYDLICAVQRQSPFCYQVSRAHMNDNRYLEGAVARYKGFLHLIKRNAEKSVKSFSVPTYDIDLIWHTHQLHPASYCKDLLEIMGKVLNHDDTDSDRTKGEKLDVGFSATTKTFEEMYGSRYSRAGAMYRGSTPSPVRTMPYPISTTKKVAAASENQKIDIPKIKDLEVMLEFVNVRNLPEEQKGSLLVSFSKTQPDAIFNAKRSLTIFSESGVKQVATFHCEPTGHLIFELMSCFPPSLPLPKSSKSLGVASVSLEDFLSPDSSLIFEKWLELVPNTNTMESKPIGLRVAISVTVPNPLPYVLHIVNSQPFSKASCSFPVLTIIFAKSRTHVFDAAGDLVMSLQMRSSKKLMGNKKFKRKQVIGTTAAGETRTLAKFVDSEWSMVNSPWFLQLPSSNDDDGHILQLSGPHIVRLFPGSRLDYESKCCEKHKCGREIERHLVTAVEFSADDPYGRAVALLDLKSGIVKVKEEWFLLPCLILALILGKEGYHSPASGGKTAKEKGLPNEEVARK
ncbi:glycine-rich domain-containing protein 1-like [Henckelia pumila]|uniref:glycine-rich domain-containing protein 1-like n=1 Tax=Henckelia pumila TaxID=405737 RepID=UPI003C6DD365